MNNNYESHTVFEEDEELPRIRPIMIRVQGLIFALAIIAFGFFLNL